MTENRRRVALAGTSGSGRTFFGLDQRGLETSPLRSEVSKILSFLGLLLEMELSAPLLAGLAICANQFCQLHPSVKHAKCRREQCQV